MKKDNVKITVPLIEDDNSRKLMDDYQKRQRSIVFDGDDCEPRIDCSSINIFSNDETQDECVKNDFLNILNSYEQREAEIEIEDTELIKRIKPQDVNATFKVDDEIRDENTKDKINAFAIARFLAENFIFGKRDTNLYLYDAKNGVFSALSSGIGSDSLDHLIRTGVKNNIKPYLNGYIIRDVRPWLLANEQVVQLPEFDNPDLIAFENGTLNLRTKKLLQHESENYLTGFIRANYYNPHKNMPVENTVFWDYLQHLADYQPNVVKALQMLLGLALSNIRSLKIAFVVFGESSNGKSVFANLISKLVGYGKVASISLMQLGERFTSSEIFDKSVLLSADEDLAIWSQKTVGMFKKVISRDNITVERKYEHPFSFRPNCLVICFSNALPCYDLKADAGGAISRRIYLIPSGKSVAADEEDPDLISKLWEERDVIVSWAIEGVYEILERGNLPEKIMDAKPIVKTISPKDAFENWVNNFVVESEEYTSSKTFWVHFCENTEEVFPMIKEKNFYMMMAKKFKMFKLKEGVSNGYYGIGLLGKEE